MQNKQNIIILAIFLVVVYLLTILVSHSKKNIILITIDTLRADHLPLYGYKRNTAPFLTSLGEEGIVFERFYTSAPATGPAHASLLTGMEVAKHGTITDDYPFNPPEPPLQMILRSEHYKTAAFVSSSILDSKSGYSRGFDFFDDNFPFNGNKRDTNTTLKAAEHWISMHSREKFFCWIHLFDVHRPFIAPEGFRGKFTNEKLSRYTGSEEELYEIDKTQRKLSKKDLQDIIGYYDEEILYVDAMLKEFIEWLKLVNLYNNTLIFITSDHGEELYTHFRHLRHSLSLYNSVLQIPLIILNTGLMPRRVREAFFIIDIFPTICSLAGIKKPDYVQGIPIIKDGKIVKPEHLRTLVAVREPYPDIMGGNAVAQIAYPWKMIKFFNGPTLYLNLEIDPKEDTYLYMEDYPPVLREKMKKWIDKNYWRQARAKYFSPPGTEKEPLAIIKK